MIIMGILMDGGRLLYDMRDDAKRFCPGAQPVDLSRHGPADH